MLLQALPASVDLDEIRSPHLVHGPRHGRARPARLHDHLGPAGADRDVVVDDSVLHDGRRPAVLDRLQACLAGHFDVEHRRSSSSPPATPTPSRTPTTEAGPTPSFDDPFQRFAHLLVAVGPELLGEPLLQVEDVLEAAGGELEALRRVRDELGAAVERVRLPSRRSPEPTRSRTISPIDCRVMPARSARSDVRAPSVLKKPKTMLCACLTSVYPCSCAWRTMSACRTRLARLTSRMKRRTVRRQEEDLTFVRSPSYI